MHRFPVFRNQSNMRIYTRSMMYNVPQRTNEKEYLANICLILTPITFREDVLLQYLLFIYFMSVIKNSLSNSRNQHIHRNCANAHGT